MISVVDIREEGLIGKMFLPDVAGPRREIASVVAVVPSCVTYGGVPNEKEASWTLGGKPFPIAPSPTKQEVLKQLETKESVNLAEIFLEKTKDRSAFEKAFIKVENIRCPVLLISGKDDKMWPSALYLVNHFVQGLFCVLHSFEVSKVHVFCSTGIGNTQFHSIASF